MVKKLKKLNMISAIAFLVSSLSLWFIPFLKFENGMPGVAYLIAALFWIGMILGISLQIFISIKSKKYSSKNSLSKKFVPAVISGVALITLIIQIVLRSRSITLEILSLFIAVLSLQLGIVINRKGCLK